MFTSDIIIVCAVLSLLWILQQLSIALIHHGPRIIEALHLLQGHCYQQ